MTNNREDYNTKKKMCIVLIIMMILTSLLTISVSARTWKCPICGGDGWDENWMRECTTCDGTGYISDEDENGGECCGTTALILFASSSVFIVYFGKKHKMKK